MDSLTDKFSVFDYFNLIIGGAIFWLGVGICNETQLAEALSHICGEVETSSVLVFLLIVLAIIVTYITGAVLNEGAHLIFKKGFKWEETKIKNCLIDEEIIGNPIKLHRYKQKASYYLNGTNSEVQQKFEPDQCAAFYAYCVYYIQVRNQNQKPERLREVQGLSGLLTCVFAAIPIGSIILSPDNISICERICANLKEYLLCFALAVIFLIKHRRDTLYRIRMVLAVYDACYDMCEKT